MLGFSAVGSLVEHVAPGDLAMPEQYFDWTRGSRERSFFGGREVDAGGYRHCREAYEAFAEELGHEPGDIALAWLLHQPAVTAPIVGPRTQEQLDSAIRAVDLKLDAASLAKLNEIFPGRKPAPEQYAW